MQKIIEFPRAVADGAAHQVAGAASAVPPQTVRTIWAAIDALTRTLENVATLCAAIPDGPVRDRLEAERARLVVGLFTARQIASRLPSAAASTAAPEVSDRPIALHHQVARHH